MRAGLGVSEYEWSYFSLGNRPQLAKVAHIVREAELLQSLE